MITAFASVENAITAMKRGAFDYITKPFKNDEVLVVLRNAMERRRLVAENQALRQNLQERYHKFANIIGRSPSMRQVFDLIIQAAPSRSTILIQGESGTGKELVARAIHTHSPRVGSRVRDGELRQPAARPARVDAVRPREGRLHRRGVSEEGAVRARRQGQHLLRRDRQHPARDAGQAAARDAGARVHAPGGMETIKVDVRIIAATNVDLRQDDGGGPLPGGSLLPAARHHHRSCRRCANARTTSRCSPSTSSRSTARRTRSAGLELTPEALDLLMEYDWPGNVRELENVIERAVVLSVGPRIGSELIPEHVRRTPTFQMPQFVVPPEGISLQGRHHRLREAADRVDARGGRRRAEARGRAAAHQADDAQRDDQAVRHPAAPEAAGETSSTRRSSREPSPRGTSPVARSTRRTPVAALRERSGDDLERAPWACRSGRARMTARSSSRTCPRITSHR